MKSLTIGNVKLKNPIFLAPMVDVTDLPYRILCRKAGAGMAYTEMLNIGAILHSNIKTQNMLKTNKEDFPSGVQITGRNVDEFKKVIPYVKKFKIIDINCGCPSIRITDNASGSYLLKHPEKIGSMIKVLKENGLTTTVKIRLGFKKNNVMKVAKEIEKSGAVALTLHARMAFHGRDVPADWSWIKKVKKEIGIPVIGNGDIFTGEDVEKILEICDGAMISRGAIGNPLIFKSILHYLKTGKEITITPKDRINQFKKYLILAKKYDVVEINRIKYLGVNFFKGFEGASKIRGKISRVKSFDETMEIIKRLV